MKSLFLSFVIVGLVILPACRGKKESSFRVFYVNSYHAGYQPSDVTQERLQAVLQSDTVIFEMDWFDGKHLAGDSLKKDRARVIYEKIEAFGPDLVLVSDDDAIQYLVCPYLNGSDIPLLFCGVNWSGESYQLDQTHIRGMLEVLPLRASLDTLFRYFPNMKRIGILSENSVSEQKNRQLLDTLYRNLDLEPYYALVDSFNQWVSAFRLLNDSVDVIFVPTNGSIRNWDSAQVKALLSRELKVPVFTCDDFMMEYAVFGMTKVPTEQGEWLGNAALSVIRGEPVERIRNTVNQKAYYYWNPALAAKVALVPSPALRKLVQEYNVK